MDKKKSIELDCVAPFGNVIISLISLSKKNIWFLPGGLIKAALRALITASTVINELKKDSEGQFIEKCEILTIQ